jgi:uncharacterized protein with PIN domain
VNNESFVDEKSRLINSIHYNKQRMLGEFERCPKCKRGYMRPTAKELEDERFDLRVYLCDNDSCRTKLLDAELKEHISNNKPSSVFSHYQ